MLKNRLGLLFCLCVIVSLVIPTAWNSAYAAESSNPTANEKLETLIKAGIIEADGFIEHDSQMNRAQFARVAALIMGLEGIGNPDTKVVTEQPFHDVPLDSWYVEEIAAAKEAGIFTGNTQGNFMPENEITVEQLAVVTVRMLGLEPVEGAEVKGASDWAKDYIQALLDIGMTIPTDYTQPASRAQLVDLTYTAVEMQADMRQTEQADTENADEGEQEDGKEEEEQEEPEEQVTPNPDPPVYVPPTPVLATPAASPAGGEVAPGTPVTLVAEVGATIYYTTDGSTPSTSNGQVYTAPIIVNSDMTIKAIAIQGGKSDSRILAVSYTVIVEEPEPTALDLIIQAAEAGDWSGIDETIFAEAGVTGVTEANLADVIDALMSDGSASWTVEQLQAIVDLVNSEEPEPTALELIHEAAEAGDWSGIDETIFAEAGVTGVTEANLADVIDALTSDGSTSWTVEQLQEIVDLVISEEPEPTALDLIHEAAEAGDWSGIDETIFAEAGVTGVTEANLADVIDALTSDGSTSWTVEQLQEIVDLVNSEEPERTGLDLINYESEQGILSSFASKVTVQTFVDSGITDVTSDNLYQIRYYLEFSSKPYPRDASDIQEIVHEAIQDMMVSFIYDYLRGFGSAPDVDVFERAGITGVDASNIDAILGELTWAYQESQGPMGGTPMSTQQDIQDVVDLYLSY